MKSFLFGFFVLFSCVSVAATFPANTHYDICFTPGRYCIGLLVNTINNAKTSIYIQAYTFSSYSIANALVAAKRRGVTVKVLLDKTNLDPKSQSKANILLNAGIPIWVDNNVAIAHNKVMIIDGDTVETGSFNYTYSAQKANAENMLIIHDYRLAQLYLANWWRRQKLSKLQNQKESRIANGKILFLASQ